VDELTGTGTEFVQSINVQSIKMVVGAMGIDHAACGSDNDPLARVGTGTDGVRITPRSPPHPPHLEPL
jgi:hypothetical protein